MKKIYSIVFLFITLVMASGCKKEFEDKFKNPNQAEHVPPDLIFTGIINEMYEAPFGGSERWGQYTAANYFYYNTNNYDWTGASLD
ncbi:MAG TPA: hypothetical protein VNZ46_11825, partial [Pedobacter sp.]|nr:hypothetical protein [Pedobacter sp.]